MHAGDRLLDRLLHGLDVACAGLGGGGLAIIVAEGVSCRVGIAVAIILEEMFR